MGIKVMPIVLPQYYETEINNAFWGKGFTDWQNVKSNKPLFDGHPVPDIPLDGYYDLSSLGEWKKQISKAEYYGLDGFIFYHYWFKDKVVLEEPIKRFLEVNNNLEFALSWANESWARTWDGKSKEVLISQDYGDLEDWRKHFEYLKFFFRDRNYLKIANKPVLIIYDISQLEKHHKMLKYFIDESKKIGFSGLHLIYTEGKQIGRISTKMKSYFKGKLLFEPILSFKQLNKNRITRVTNMYRHRVANQPVRWSYDKVTRQSLNNINNNKKWDIPCGYVEWDNSARKGRKSNILRFNSLSEWESYHNEFVRKVLKSGSQIVTYNAWNEWAEGATIDKSERNSDKVLKALQLWKRGS